MKFKEKKIKNLTRMNLITQQYGIHATIYTAKEILKDFRMCMYLAS